MFNKDKWLGAGGASMVALGAFLGAAQAAAQTVQEEEIIVTAEKRSENINDLPIAISAYSGEDLEAAGVQQLRDLQTQSASLTVSDRGSGTVVTIRGIGSEISNIGSEPGVTISQDGVVLARDIYFRSDFMDIGRVEVLRGPQGTISGRNATGGAINIISNQPTEEFEAGFGVTVGNFERYATNGFVSGRLGEGADVLGRLAFATDNADGWLHDAQNDQDLGSRESIHVRGILATDLDGPFSAALTLDALTDNSLPISTVSIGPAAPGLQSLGDFYGVPDADVDNLVFNASQPEGFWKEQAAASLRMGWDFSPRTSLESTTGYLYLAIENAIDTDGTGAIVGDFSNIGYDAWQFSQELTLTSDLTERLDLILGALYLREHSEQPIIYLGLGFPFDDLPVQDLTSTAVYGQLRYRLTDALRVSAGVRYTRDDKEYDESSALLGGHLGSIEDSWNALTPRVAVDYTINDDWTAYANVSRGFKAGGINTLSIAFASVPTFEPEYVWNYEAGLKGTLFDGRLRTAIAAFHMDYTDVQQTLFGSSGGAPTSLVINVPEATIDGVELELDVRITDNFRVALATTWLDATMGDFLSVDPLDPPNVINLNGNRLSHTPEWQAVLTTEYTIPLSGDASLDLRADYSWRDQTYFDIFNKDAVSQEAFGLLNLSAQLSFGNWSITAFGRNVTDERYLNNGQLSLSDPNVPQNLGTIGEPRTYGVSLNVQY